MQVTEAYLFGVHTTTEPTTKSTPVRAAEREVSIYLPAGVGWGWFALVDLSSSIPSFWTPYVNRFYRQYTPDALGPYSVTLSVAELNPDSIRELSDLKTDLPKRVNELYAAVFPERTKPKHSGGHTYPSILFCQLDPKEYARPVEDLADDAVCLMGFDKCAVFPAQLDNALFAAGAYTMLEYESVCAFALEPPPAPLPNGIGIPYIVRQALGLQSFIAILEDLRERADRLPFVRKTVAGYLSSFATRKQTQYSQQFLSFMNDSGKASIETKTIEDILRAVKGESTRNDFLCGLPNAKTFRVRLPPINRGSVVEILGKEYQNAEQQVTEELTTGNDRQKSIGDYLRDAATSEATVVNYGLQRVVIWLTIAAVLIAVLGIVPGLMTDEQKKKLWHVKDDTQSAPIPAPTNPSPPSAPSQPSTGKSSK